MLIHALTALSLMTTPVSDPDIHPRVTVEQGALEGRSASGIDAFKGVPFAAPPVGSLRWRPPQAAASWEGVRDASLPGAICIQPPANGDPGVGPLPMSEDCLTLNVWTPIERTGPLPVMVWIHGGGLNNGSGTAELYDGARLARRGVVVVTINYRLGRLGYFDHPALLEERSVDEAFGNYGLMDQVAALEWVRDNIARFGGDPGDVTIFGESAGGVAVTQLMIAPPARGLFHKAVVQSGLGRQQGSSPVEMLERGGSWAPRLSADDLRAMAAEDFLKPAPSFYGGDLILNDGPHVSEDVEAAFAAGREAPVPFIIGTNSAEFWWIKASDKSAYGATDDAMTPEERAAAEAVYGGAANYDAAVMSDLIFNEPARHLARLHAGNGHPTWLYRFDVVPDSNPEPSGGATHASERPYVFDNLHTVGRPMGDRDARAATAMADYWTKFAKTGDPNGEGRPLWPAFGADERLLEFTNDGPVARPIPHADRLDVLEAYRARIR